MIEAEAGDRRARNMVFAPIAPLCAAAGPFSGLSFPPRALALIWKALKADYPDEVAAAKDLAAGWGGPTSTPERFDALCARAAAGLRAGRGAVRRGGGRPPTRAAAAPRWPPASTSPR